MSAPMFFRKEIGGKLTPCDEHAVAALSKVKTGDSVVVEIRRPRNLRHHRKFWALVNLVFNNQEHYESPDHLVAALKTTVGHCDLVPSKDGSTMVALPKSIAFHRMDQTAFEAFYDKCIDVIARHFLPGVDSDALRAEVEELLR